MNITRKAWTWLPVRARTFAFKALPTAIQGKLRHFLNTEPTTNHFGYEINTRLMYLTGGGPETFDAMARYHMDALREFIGINPDHHLIEIGCGIGRDAIPLTKILGRNGTYLGIDIIQDSINWCRENISTRYPNFKFLCYNVKDQLHNPGGSTDTNDIRLEAPDQSIDRIFLWSVFTHMTKADISHYLREFTRVLKPSGLVYATWFIVDENVLDKARETNLTPFDLRFEHPFGEGCLVNDLNAPMGAVAYTRPALLEMIGQSGLELVGDVLPGSWSGYYEIPKGGQDGTVLRPARTAP